MYMRCIWCTTQYSVLTMYRPPTLTRALHIPPPGGFVSRGALILHLEGGIDWGGSDRLWDSYCLRRKNTRSRSGEPGPAGTQGHCVCVCVCVCGVGGGGGVGVGVGVGGGVGVGVGGWVGGWCMCVCACTMLECTCACTCACSTCMCAVYVHHMYVCMYFLQACPQWREYEIW